MLQQTFKLLAFTLIVVISCQLKAELYTYELKHINADQVISVIQPHLDKTSKLTSNNKVIFAEVSEQDNLKILSMLKLLDQSKKQYSVEVKILNRKLESWERKATRIFRSDSSNQSKKVLSTQPLDQQNQAFKLRISEGQPGFVNTGEAFPTHQIVAHYDKFLPKTSVQSTSSGFYVTVIAATENQVTLNISAKLEQRSSNLGDSSSSSTATQVSGNLGEWLLIAAMTNDNDSNKTTEKTYSTSDLGSKQRWYYAKVKTLSSPSIETISDTKSTDSN